VTAAEAIEEISREVQYMKKALQERRRAPRHRAEQITVNLQTSAYRIRFAVDCWLEERARE